MNVLARLLILGMIFFAISANAETVPPILAKPAQAVVNALGDITGTAYHFAGLSAPRAYKVNVNKGGKAYRPARAAISVRR